MKDYQTNELDAAIPLPASVSVAMADIAATMREGLLAMAVGAGLSVMQSLDGRVGDRDLRPERASTGPTARPCVTGPRMGR